MSNAIVMDGSIAHGFDEDLNAWIFWFRGRAAPKFRTIGVSIAADLDQIPFPQMILAPDAQDPPECQFNHLASIKVAGGYVGLLCDMRPREGYKMEPQLAFSRDARTWSRPAGRAPIIPCGEEGSWDDMAVCPGGPVAVGDDVYIVYHGSNTGNGEWRLIEKNGQKEVVRFRRGDALPDGRLNLPGIGLAKLKRDRWVVVEPISGTGTLHTKLLCFAGRELRVNADAREGSIRAELLDHQGRPLDGFTMNDSDPFSGDSVGHRVRWKGKRLLPVQMLGTAYSQGVPGRVMSIRFHLDRSRLFAFSC